MKNKTFEEAKKAKEEAWAIVMATPEHKDWEEAYKATNKACKALEAVAVAPALKAYNEAKKATHKAWKAVRETSEYKEYKEAKEILHKEYIKAKETLEAFWGAEEAMWATPKYKAWGKACKAYEEAARRN